MMTNYVRTVSIVVLFCAINGKLIAQTSPKPEQQYQSMLEQYNQGKSDPQFLQQLTAMALKFKDRRTADKISERFYKNGTNIDQAMGAPGYAEHFLDQVILSEEVRPIMFPRDKLSPSEPDWQAITNTITKRFDASYAERAVLSARADWLCRHQDYPGFAMLTNERIAKYPPHALGGMDGDVWLLNVSAWNMFLKASDKEVLNSALNWSDLSLKRDVELLKKSNAGDSNGPLTPQMLMAAILDTKANLLYKLGRTDEAITVEQQAATEAEKAGNAGWVKSDYKTVELMKNHLPTWTTQ